MGFARWVKTDNQEGAVALKDGSDNERAAVVAHTFTMTTGSTRAAARKGSR
jgi:hypothetical protein